METKEENLLRHWTQGGTGLTNFDANMLPVYQRAVEKFGDPNYFIENRPFNPIGGGSANWEGYSLHCKTRGDASDFWRVFDIEYFYYLDEIIQEALNEHFDVKSSYTKAHTYICLSKEHNIFPKFSH